MRYNKKNTKKTIQRKLTTRKQRKNNRSLPRRTQYKTHKSYKQMKGGAVRTTTVKNILNPENNDPNTFIGNPENPMLIGALIIKQYNELKGMASYLKNLPYIPNSQAILTVDQNKDVNKLALFYISCFDAFNETPVVDEYSQFFSDLKAFQPDEFRMWLTYILEGNVYKKKLPFYTDNEFHKFKLLALSLQKLLQVFSQSSNNHPPSNPKPVALLEYEKYEVFNILGLKDLLSNFVRSPILYEMACVISLIRGPTPIWKWFKLSDSENLSPNPYCATRRTKRLFVSPQPPQPLDKINVSRLKYQMQTVDEYSKAIKGIIDKIVSQMLEKFDIDNIKKLLDETSQFTHIMIVDKDDYYKYYEFKIRHSIINNPDHVKLTIPVIICTLSGFDEDGICDFEFVYVGVTPLPTQSDTPPVEEEDHETKVKQETYYKLRAEITRIQSLLGGQTWNAPHTAEGTQKQYYDTISLNFNESRTGNATDGKSNESPRVLIESQNSEEPCTLILNHESNQDELVWKAAIATSTQNAAFKCVDEYLQKNHITTLDDTMIRVYKISNGQPSPADITVFVEVKKLDTNFSLLQVEYQALGGERYEVYNNSTNARAAAGLNKAHYNWVTSTGPS